MRIDSRRGAALVIAVLALPHGASAETSPWSLGVGLSQAYDDNVFRAPPEQAVGDHLRSLFLTGTLDQAIGRQQLQASATVRDTRYENRTDLDYRGYSLQSAWNGSTAGNLSWNLNVRAQRTLASYADALDARERVANVETSRQLGASLQLGLVADWVAGLNAGRRTLDYSSAIYAPDELVQNHLGLSVTWHPLGPLSITSGPRITLGRYPNAQDGNGAAQPDRFRRRDWDLAAQWAVSGASQLSARVSLSRQRHDLQRSLDFSGTTGELGWQWQPGARTRLNLSLARDTGSETSFFSLGAPGAALRGSGDSSQVSRSVTLGLAYQLGAKASLTAQASAARRHLVSASRLTGGTGPIDLGTRAGDEPSHGLQLGLRYEPLRSLQLACDAGRTVRTGVDGLSTTYRATQVSCSGQLSVQ